jgi:hypothetical protein
VQIEHEALIGRGHGVAGLLPRTNGVRDALPLLLVLDFMAGPRLRLHLSTSVHDLTQRPKRVRGREDPNGTSLIVDDDCA